jgi:diguanylate cyclase (GGDEF)-like protein/PAS domain S-box-containing protein
MLSFLNRLSVRNRIWVIVTLLIGSIVLGNVMNVMMLREVLWHEKELKTRQLVDSASSVLWHFHGLQKSGTLSEAEAQKAAIGTIRAMRYSETEYFWLNDLGTPIPRMIMHPTMPNLDGQLLDASQFTLPNSKKNLFVAFIELVNQQGQGYITYPWPKPQTGGGVTEAVYPKLSYVKKFSPWGWLIGSGIYIDDVDAAVQKQALRNTLLAAGAGALLLLLASLIARSITQPLHLTVSAMRAIGKEDGTPVQRLPLNGHSEIAELAAGFNDMLRHLEERDARLAGHQAYLENEVTQRTLELNDTNGQLQKELTERRQAEQVIQENRIRMRALLDATSESVLLLNPQGDILAINAFAAERFGQTPESITGKNFYPLLPADLAISRRALVQKVISTGQPFNSQDRRGAVFFNNSLYPVKDNAGTVESVAVYAKDVTEQHCAKEVETIFRRLDTLLLKWRMNLESIAQLFCDDILPVFDLAAAWVGRAEKDGQLTLLASTESSNQGLLTPFREKGLRWDSKSDACVPVGRVIRSGHLQVITGSDRACPLCNTDAANGAQSALILPLTLRGETWGVLTLYGQDAAQFEGTQLPARLMTIAARLGAALESALQQEWLTLLDTALAGVHNAVFITDASAKILWINRSFTQLSGYAPETILGKTPEFFILNTDIYKHICDTIQHSGTWHGDVVNLRCDGSRYTVSQTVTPLRNASDEISHYVAILEDITERKAAEERIQHAAQFDLLTELPNRGLFFDRLGQALALARRDGLCGALLFLDLDRFKEVNDRLGHAAGDSLLIAVARRLRDQVRESDTVARLGGDEFTVILPSLRDQNDAICVANNILAAIAEPFLLAGSSASVGISIGIALFPEHGQSAEHILSAADNATYLAKKAGRNCYVVATAEVPKKRDIPLLESA